MSKSKRILKWLYPGMGVKRWVLIAAFGIFLIAFGSAKFKIDLFLVLKILDIIMIVSGIVILILGIKRMIRSFVTILIPQVDQELVDIMYQKRQLDRGLKVVTIGGGTGLSVILTGLKEYTSHITAIVTVADSGGSSGRLREQFDILPPGDIRNCLVALADAPVLMRDLFQFRFDKSTELGGHSFGNLFITVMTQLTGGDFEKAIKESSRVLAIRGRVIPSTLNKVTLVAEYKDGTVMEGEADIPKIHKTINRVYLRPENSRSTPDAVTAIKEADIVILGPGSLYTSIIPNLLIKEITEALTSSDALKIYVCNIMTQNGETDEFSASDHVKALTAHTNSSIINYCIVNDGKIPLELLERYTREKSYPIVADTRKIRDMGYRVIEEDIVFTTDYIRHDSEKLARLIMGLNEEI